MSKIACLSLNSQGTNAQFSVSLTIYKLIKNIYNMNKDYLELRVNYDLTGNKFTYSGDLNGNGVRDVVESFLRSQIGAGSDERRLNERKDYSIELKWHPSDDKIDVSDNTGNRSLREGILLQFLESLD